MKIRIDELATMSGRELIAIADKMKIKIACNKERTALKEKKTAVVERITAEVLKIKAQLEEAEKAQKAKAEKEAKKGRTAMTTEERKAKRSAYRRERNAKYLESTKELLASGQYEFNGKIQSLTDWSRELEISRKNLYRRIHYMGWTIERAFTTK